MLDFVVFLLLAGAAVLMFSGARREASLLWQGWSYALAASFVITDLQGGGMSETWFLAEMMFLAVAIFVLLYPPHTPEPPKRRA